jgi:hypothetical protein
MPFVIKTDPISLKHLLEQRLHHTLQHKGLCKLLGLDYVIQYKRCVENTAANALSIREHMNTSGEVVAVTALNPQWLDEFRNGYNQDPWAMQILLQHQHSQPLP